MLKKTTLQDIESVVRLYKQASAYFKENNIDQWQNNYPNKQSLINDIDKGFSFVLEQENSVCASMACIPERDMDYDTIYEGSWLNDEPYLTIHRIVVDKKAKNTGVAHTMMQEAINVAKKLNIDNIRIDTHQDNKAMLRFLEKEGFVYCGVVFIQGVSKRLAFQKVLID